MTLPIIHIFIVPQVFQVPLGSLSSGGLLRISLWDSIPQFTFLTQIEQLFPVAFSSSWLDIQPSLPNICSHFFLSVEPFPLTYTELFWGSPKRIKIKLLLGLSSMCAKFKWRQLMKFFSYLGCQHIVPHIFLKKKNQS